jgi:hypothetical protein
VPAGLKEQAFYLGSREVAHLFDELILLNTTDSPYQPKNTRVFTTQNVDSRIVLSLPFRVETEESIYVGLTDLSPIQSLDVAIYNKESNEEVTVSRQGNYFSSISAQ